MAKRMPQAHRNARMGALTPRYSFLLNPYPNERFTRCPRCEASTRVRKIPFVIHVDSIGLVMLRKTCRLCIVCEMLIAHKAEMDNLIDGLRGHHADGLEYLVLGTLESKTWRQGLSGAVTVEQVRDHMTDFKAYMRVDITPRHWSRASATTD